MQVSILVVTDEAPLRETVLEMARMCGMTAHGAEDFVQASDLLSNISADILLVPKVPAGTGWPGELAYLKRIAPAVKVVLASTYLDEDWSAKSLFDAHLRKPFTVADLRRAVRALT